MECCDITRNFLQGRKGKSISVLVQGEGFRPTTGKLVDFNDSAIVLEKPDGLQWLIDLDYVKSVADATNGVE